MQLLQHVLTAEGMTWLIVDAQGIVLATSGENAPIQAGEPLPWPKGTPWPPAQATTIHLTDLGETRLYPQDNGNILAIVGPSYTSLVETLSAERERLPRLISIITHELRLPLTSIKGYADLLIKGVTGPLTDQQKHFLEVILNNVGRMAVLIDRVSEMGKLESGRLRPQREPFLLTHALAPVLETYQPLCEDKAQTCEVEIPDDLPVVVGDKDRVKQIFEALLDNAHKYTPKGGKILVRAEAIPQGVRVTVCDTGPGIATEDAIRVFEAFFRSEIPEVREHPGWGLSLHVAHQLAAHMGGELGFESTPGQGACFWLLLPIAGQ